MEAINQLRKHENNVINCLVAVFQKGAARDIYFMFLF